MMEGLRLLGRHQSDHTGHHPQKAGDSINLAQASNRLVLKLLPMKLKDCAWNVLLLEEACLISWTLAFWLLTSSLLLTRRFGEPVLLQPGNRYADSFGLRLAYLRPFRLPSWSPFGRRVCR